MKPVCVKCQRFYRPKKNGAKFIEGMPVGDARAPSGTSRPDLWKPYKLWCGDLWRCDGCGNEIIVGVAIKPISEHYMNNFEKEIEAWRPIVQVNDC